VSATGTPQPGSDAEDKDIECLTPEEELVLVRYYCEKTVELGDTYRPPLPTNVRVSPPTTVKASTSEERKLLTYITDQATAIQYLRRFYLTNSPMTYHPKSIMACALFVATKTDNYYMSLRQFAEGIPGDTTADDVIAPEFLLMQGLRFTLDVRHPFRGLEGGVMELSAIAQGQGKPAPHLPHHTPESLKQGLLSLAPPPVASTSITDRIGRAHGATRELLKSAAQMTDAYFLYTPSQIWLAAFLLADKPLAEFYLETKLGGPLDATTANPSDLQNPLYELRTKLFEVLTDCGALLQSYTPLSSDPDQMKSLKRIAKKLYHCQNPEKVNLKRDSAVPRSTPAGDAGTVTSESETERLAKKRKLEMEKQRGPPDLFGPELVADRTKH
jgi:cyclin H